MRARQLTPNLVQLTGLRFVNAYLVREDDGFTPVDTTVPRDADALLAAAEAGPPIRRIALTHGHGNHVGSLDELHGRLDGGDVVDGKLPAEPRSRAISRCPSRSRPWPRGTRSSTSTRPAACGRSSRRRSPSATLPRCGIPSRDTVRPIERAHRALC